VWARESGKKDEVREVRSQRSEVRRQKAKGRKQRAGDRELLDQKAESAADLTRIDANKIKN
jgi:hypothetical protein